MPSIINSDDGVVSGTSGLKTTGGNDGITTFQQNGTERMRIDSSGNVGIGRAPVTYGSFRVLDVAGASGAIQKWIHTGSAIELQAYATSQITGIGSATNTPLTFTTNDTERMRINAGAPILCLSGGNTSATGTGIAFPATQSASTDANTLDDYEEGTWTPVFTAGTTPPTGVTYTTQVARYTKIGKSVTVWGQITLSSKGTGGAGEVRITGLPFTSENVTGLFCRGAGDIASATWAANITQIQFSSVPNDTYIAMIQSGSGQALSNPTWANQNNNSAYNFCITYATST